MQSIVGFISLTRSKKNMKVYFCKDAETHNNILFQGIVPLR